MNYLAVVNLFAQFYFAFFPPKEAVLMSPSLVLFHYQDAVKT